MLLLLSLTDTLSTYITPDALLCADLWLFETNRLLVILPLPDCQKIADPLAAPHLLLSVTLDLRFHQKYIDQKLYLQYSPNLKHKPRLHLHDWNYLYVRY